MTDGGALVMLTASAVVIIGAALLWIRDR